MVSPFTITKLFIYIDFFLLYPVMLSSSIETCARLSDTFFQQIIKKNIKGMKIRNNEKKSITKMMNRSIQHFFSCCNDFIKNCG